MSINIDDVAYIKWTPEKIGIVRDAMKASSFSSERKLAKALEDKGISGASHQNIHKLLAGTYKIVSLEIATGIAETLLIPVEKLIKIYAFIGYEG